MALERASILDLCEVVERQREFWGERDMAHLHHPMLVHDFGETALVIRGPGGRVQAYLFGLLTPSGVGYVHLVGVQAAQRRRGLARILYEEFQAIVESRDGVALKAITRPVNEGSVAFHRALGFSVREVPGYSGPGEMRLVMERRLADPAAGMSN
jgi:ribosomal protein S18 acetylase RimI-like enzyme